MTPLVEGVDDLRMPRHPLVELMVRGVLDNKSLLELDLTGKLLLRMLHVFFSFFFFLLLFFFSFLSSNLIFLLCSFFILCSSSSLFFFFDFFIWIQALVVLV